MEGNWHYGAIGRGTEDGKGKRLTVMEGSSFAYGWQGELQSRNLLKRATFQ